MKKELVIQLVILGAAVCLLLAALFRQRQITPVEIPDRRLEQLVADFDDATAIDSDQEPTPIPTPFPETIRETSY